MLSSFYIRSVFPVFYCAALCVINWLINRNSPTLFRTVPFPTPYGLPFPKIWGSQPQPKTAVAIISGTGKAVYCIFGRYIHRVHPNKSPWEKRERGRIQGLPKSFRVSPIISGMGKLRTLNFVHIRRIHRNKSPLKISAKVVVGVLRDCRFLGHPYGTSRGHLCGSSAFLFIFAIISVHVHDFNHVHC